MKICTFDLETIADKSKIDLLPEVQTDSRLKDPTKIKTDIAAKRLEQVNKMGLVPATAMICVFGWHDGEKTRSIILDKETPDAEKKLLTLAWAELKKAEHFVTFNGINFDVPVLLMRSLLNRVKPSVRISTKKYVIANHTDIRMILGRWDTYAKGNLDFYSRLLLGKTSKGSFDGSQVQDVWDMNLKDNIAKYCEDDCQMTWEIFDLISQYYI